MSRTYRTVIAALVLLASIALFAPFARASTSTYTYTGSKFTTFGGTDTYPPECSISGSFTISTLAGGLTNVFITPSSFQFTDGFAKLNDTSPYSPFGFTSFMISTNAAGQIIAWNILLDAPTVAYIQTYNGPGTPFDETWDAPLYANYASVEYASGSPGWTSSAPPVPEPGSLVLLGTGLIGLAGSLRRKLLG